MDRVCLPEQELERGRSDGGKHMDNRKEHSRQREETVYVAYCLMGNSEVVAVTRAE